MREFKDVHQNMLQVPPPPWRRLLTSLPVWACAIATLGSQWGQATLQLAVTKYLMLVYGFALRYVRIYTSFFLEVSCFTP
jgi:hypothetical protein